MDSFFFESSHRPRIEEYIKQMRKMVKNLFFKGDAYTLYVKVTSMNVTVLVVKEVKFSTF